jgi:glycerophosphoryl diester phosphodiesterase
MEIYSHRGIGLGPENSLTSIKEAKKRGVKYEADVRKSKDGQLVLYHNPGLVEAKSFNELKDLGIASLDDALKQGVSLDLDIKEGVRGAEVLEMVEDHNLLESMIFTSFDPLTIREIRNRNKQAVVGLLTEQDKKLSPYGLPFIKGKMGIILPHADTLTQAFTDSAHKLGLKVITWCPSNEKVMQKNVAYGVDGMIINDAKPLE